jgi:hypothetical protein
MKNFKLIGLVAALLPLLPSLAQAQVNIKVSTTNESNVIRRDISRTTFGTGLQANTAEFGWAMKSTPWVGETALDTQKLAATADTFKWLQLGSFRFPNGDSSFQYLWSDPSFSICLTDDGICEVKGDLVATQKLRDISNARRVDPAYQWSWWMTPDAIIDYTSNVNGKLNMERVFQVNTVFSPYDIYIDENVKCRGNTPPNNCTGTSFSDINMDKVADYAADWVQKDNKQTKYWEIGNEDWSRLHPEEYAKIFSSFQQKMLLKNSKIKTIAQGLEENFDAVGTTNTPENWLNALTTKLASTNSINKVYAYAIHDYLETPAYENLKGDPELRRKTQTEDLLLQVRDHAEYSSTAKGSRVAVQTVKDLLKQKAPSWKLWITEFNVSEDVISPTGAKTREQFQDMGHGLVIADWVGELLKSNIERMFFHDMSHSPTYGMMDFGKNSNNVGMKDAKVQVPGHIYSMYAKNFGQTMVKNTVSNNPNITINRTGTPRSYPQLGIYSSVSSNDQELRIMVINRDLNNKAVVNIDTENLPGRRVLADGKYCFRQISAARINESNIAASDTVKWTQPVYINQSSTGIKNQTVDRASVNLFVIPLKPNNGSATAAPVVDCGDTVKRQTDVEGFEAPLLAAGGYAYNPQGGAWAFSGTTGGGIQSDGSAWAAKAAPQGQQTAFLQGGDAHMTQMVQLAPGVHNISFYAARRASDGANVNPVQVKVNGIPIGRPISPVGAEFIKYTTESFPLDTQGSYKVEFVSTNKAAGDSSVFIDAVSINSAPKN